MYTPFTLLNNSPLLIVYCTITGSERGSMNPVPSQMSSDSSLYILYNCIYTCVCVYVCVCVCVCMCVCVFQYKEIDACNACKR